MKFFIRIFTIYFLVLTFVPCSDAVNLCTDKNINHTKELSATEDHQHSHGECGDLCSPFCYCSCCGHILFSFLVTALENKDFPPLAQNAPQIIAQLNGIIVPSGIWQPPRFI